MGMFLEFKKKRAENGTRTRDPNLGKVVLYQLSYFRLHFLCKEHLSRLRLQRYCFFSNYQTIFEVFLQKYVNSCDFYSLSTQKHAFFAVFHHF